MHIAVAVSQTSRWVGYGLAVGCTVLAALARWQLSAVPGFNSVYITFLLAVTVVAAVGGLGPGILSIVLSAVLGVVCFVEPIGRLWIGQTSETVRLGIFVVNALLICLLCEWLRAARRRARAEAAAGSASRAALHQSEERFRIAQDLSLDGFTILSAVRNELGDIIDFRWDYVNPAAAALLKSSPEALVGQRLLQVLPGNKTRSGLFESYVKVAQTGKAHDIEIPYNSEGINGWFRNMAVRLGDGVAVSFSDITRRKNAEEAVLNLALFPEQNPNPVMRVAMDRTLLYANGSSAGVLDQWRCQIGQRVPGSVLNMIGRAAGLAAPMEIDAECGNRTYSFHFAPIMASGYVNLYVRDITERRETELELRHTKEQAEEASQAKDRFLAVLSHELRTPLTPALAAAGMLAGDAALPPEVRETAQTILRNIELEARLIDDLLDLTRISRGKLALHAIPTDARERLREVVEICQDDVSARQLRLDLRLDARAHVQADPARLQQVFWNLLKNAVKFTPPGGSITIRTEHSASGELTVRFIDTGIGIEPDMLPRLFDAFEQGGRQITRQFGGLGLGLSISKALVEMHGGTLTAHSEGKGRGATFTVRLPTVAEPAAPAAPAAAPAHAPCPLHELRVLLVEDHADTARIMTRLLGSWGCQVTTAGTVGEALRSWSADQFDMVLSDLGLPDDSGLSLVRQLAQRSPDVKAVALSGYGMEENVRECREAGFVAHLTKPINADQLRNLMRELAV